MDYKWTLLSVTSVGTVMANLDSRIVIVGLPTIAKELGIDANELLWVTQIYILSATIFALLAGRTGDQVGRVKLYNIGFVIFTIGSALAAISFTGGELISSRALQGIGAALIVSNSVAMLTDAGKGKDLGTLIGFNTIPATAGAVAGLTLSGLILSITSWRALFYINIPIGIFGTFWAYKKLREVSVRDVKADVDWIGLALFSISLTLMLVSLTFLSYGVADLQLGLSMFFVGALIMVGFVRQENRTPNPLLELRLFKIKSFAVGNVATIITGTMFWGLTVFESFYLQIGLGLSPIETGLIFLPLSLSTVAVGLITGRLADRYGLGRVVSTTGVVLQVVSPLMLAFTIGNPNLTIILVAFSLMGAGNAAWFIPVRSTVLNSVSAEKRGAAAGFSTTIGSIAQSTGYGLVILLMTLVIPYGALSGLIDGTSVNALAMGQFLDASRFFLFVIAGANLLSLVPTILTNPGRVSRANTIKISG